MRRNRAPDKGMSERHDHLPAGSPQQVSADGRRVWIRRMLTRTANVCLGASLGALLVAAFIPSGWWPSVAFAGFVLYLLLNHLRLEV